ncbi:aldose 1-epimerase [Microbacteriaceae bacterium SG_E_30_P1]|uniref:Aldose 1-epimerase n=1 Tax=Antiquaquibacter oligotrophicus TaxID=2880260 RepID=A0ABT6KJA7_9MICO|nr:aldose 1-epimerase family protein [Antiquaquibacter oligotrophicus]MDH6180021.1 aldose 1-epimerase [Antiquaquibacter oligotrophicus]UDF14225.1 aldose 1-epimerase family protein [Antiquaquibacter oligotrophicus]
MTYPTGEQYEIRHGGYRAVITEVAAALREFEHDGVALNPGYPATSTPPWGSGIVLAPWPNRVEDGQWTLDGKEQQLDLTEVSRHNAIHGLLRYTPYRLVARDDASVTLAATIYPQHGYPFIVETIVTYALSDSGMTVTHTATNRSDAPAPFALGTHPFFRIGGVPTEELVLTVNASTRFDVDERLNPLAEVPVDGDYDLREGRAVGELELDTAYGGVATVEGVVATLRAPDGRELRVLQDDAHGYVQVFTTREFPLFDAAGEREGYGLAVAIEPMTAPPNAFNSGLGLHWIEPGATWNGAWGIQYAG